MNEFERPFDPPEVTEERVWRGPHFRKRHKFAVAWRVWVAFTDWVFERWPRNS